MNLNPDKQYMAVLLFLILSFFSCSTKSQSNEAARKIANQDSFLSYDFRVDTTLHLKFPNGVRAIFEDSKGNIWFGSHNEGLCHFDGTKLTYYTTKDGLSDNQVRSISEDTNGLVWFECGKGLSYFDGQKISKANNKKYFSTNIWQMGKNDLWFKGNESINYNELEGDFGVYRYDGNKLNYHIFPDSIKDNDQYSYSISTPSIKGKNGIVWFGTYGAVLGFDGNDYTIINNKSLGLKAATGLHVRSIFEDSKGRLWIGNNGIGVLLKDGKQIINFSEEQNLLSKNSLFNGHFRSPPQSLEHVFAIGEDRFGNIWFGDRDTGAWKFDGQSMTNYTKKDGLTSPFIWQIYNTKNGELWFAMNDGSVLSFNGVSFDRIF